MVTAVAAALSGCVFAARIAYRLTGPAPGRRWAPIVAAAFAGVGVLMLDGYWKLVLIANSDPWSSRCAWRRSTVISRGRPRLGVRGTGAGGAGTAGGLAVRGAVGCGPGGRTRRCGGWSRSAWGSIPILWFSVPALTSKSWLSPGDLALNSANVIHGSKITGVVRPVLGLNELPIKLAAVVALVFAVFAVIADR